ncbi:hypothetical protein F2P81_025588 [Scophthalmus maximus]|uniref:Uncharacterized protein n=1 Tax=Scophthalmus maximus TaxID=52904 RepID=A0A6A4RPD6_SCOMX|nr:hypothetical protein F2P81_025588 [Scophthalmus maximus]
MHGIPPDEVWIFLVFITKYGGGMLRQRRSRNRTHARTHPSYERGGLADWHTSVPRLLLAWLRLPWLRSSREMKYSSQQVGSNDSNEKRTIRTPKCFHTIFSKYLALPIATFP